MMDITRFTIKKLDPYLNVDPGTMNPIEHGEVFVTEDGTETDLDVGVKLPSAYDSIGIKWLDSGK